MDWFDEEGRTHSQGLKVDGPTFPLHPFSFSFLPTCFFILHSEQASERIIVQSTGFQTELFFAVPFKLAKHSASKHSRALYWRSRINSI
jgi:hypothetical protein